MFARAIAPMAASMARQQVCPAFARGFASTAFFTDQHEYAKVGDSVSQGDSVSVLESVKAATEMYAPISGTVLEVNSALESDPGMVNSSPEEEGWFVKIKVADEGETQTLMQREAYDAFAAAEEH